MSFGLSTVGQPTSTDSIAKCNVTVSANGCIFETLRHRPQSVLIAGALFLMAVVLSRQLNKAQRILEGCPEAKRLLAKADGSVQSKHMTG